jgi:hypothetical protein
MAKLYVVFAGESSAGKQNTTEPVEAKPVDEHKAEEAVAVVPDPEPSAAEKINAATTASEQPAN